jgi:ankyrin repeat protein
LKDETLTSKRHFFEQNGSHSGFVWENQEALQEWLDFLQNKSQEDQEPLDWIRQMTNPDPRSRPTAEDLRQDILKAEHGTYCGHCCNDDASSDKTSWRGSDSDDEEISVTRNTTVSNAMNTPIRPPPIHLGTSAEKGKSPMSDSSFQGKPKLPRFPWQDQTTIAVPSTNTEPYAAVYVGPSEFTEDRTSSSNLSKFETQKSEPGYFDKTSEITMDVEDNLGHIPSRTSSQADSPEETFFHTHFAPRTRNNPMRAVPVSLNPAERRETALALIDKDEDPTKGDQETIKNLFKTDHEDLEDFLLELRDQGDGSWKNTLLKAVGALEKDRRGYTLLHAAANFRNYGISRDAVEAIIQRSSEVNALNIYLNSPLHYAADRDRPSIVKYMLKFGAKIDQMNIRKQTPLHIASQMGRYDATRVLARNGSSDFVNMKDDYGKTSLHYACENANLSIAEILLDNDASLDKKDENGYTPKALAWDGDDEEFQEALDEMLAERADAMTSSSTSSRSPVRLGPQPFPTGGKPPVFSRLDLSKPCKCEVCKMTTAIESIPEAEELELLKCPCKGHLRDLSRDML